MTKKDCKYYFEITDTLGYMDEDCWGNPSIDMVQQLIGEGCDKFMTYEPKCDGCKEYTKVIKDE